MESNRVARFICSVRREPIFLPWGVFAIIYIGILLFVSPIFEFPLIDDVAYAEAVKNLVDYHTFKLSDWIAVSFIFQLMYGAVVTLPFGFSFSVLRLTTLVWSFVGASTVYLILREMGFSKVTSMWGGLLLVTNPIYLNLSYTFMTDVPFLSSTLISILFYARGIKRDNDRLLFAGSCFAAAASLIRQQAVVLPVAVLVYYAMLSARDSLTTRRIWIISLTPTIGFVVFFYWLNSIHGVPQAMSGYVSRLMGWGMLRTMRNSVGISFFAVEYLGLFLSPLMLASVPKTLANLRHKPAPIIYTLWTTIIAAGVALVYFLFEGQIMPYCNSIINDFGLGPFSLKDAVILNVPHPTTLPRLVWWLVTLLSTLSGITLLSEMTLDILSCRGLKGCVSGSSPTSHATNHHCLEVFVYLTGVGLWLSIVLTGKRFDRYFLMLLVPAMVSPLKRIGGARTITPALLTGLVLFGLFGVLGTHDYISWNRARWKGINYLLQEERVSPAEIDGGYEFNYWYNFESARQQGIEWWWALDDKYCISFSLLKGYSVVKKIPYSTYLPPQHRYIYILRRND